MSVTIKNTQNARTSNTLLERIAEIETLLSSKVDSTQVSQLETALSSKADSTQVSQLETALSSKADSTQVSQLENVLIGKASIEQIDEIYNALALKADRNGVNIFTRAQFFAETTLIFSNNIAWNTEENQVTRIVCESNFNLTNPTNVRQGCFYQLTFEQNHAGGHTVTFGTAYKFPNNEIPQLSTPPHASDRLTAVGNANGTLDCVLTKNF